MGDLEVNWTKLKIANELNCSLRVRTIRGSMQNQLFQRCFTVDMKQTTI